MSSTSSCPHCSLSVNYPIGNSAVETAQHQKILDYMKSHIANCNK